MTEADLGMKSIPRNPLLFGILHRMEAVEKIGSGIRRIRNLCRQHGVPEALIEVSESWVSMTFPGPPHKSGPSADQVESRTPPKLRERLKKSLRSFRTARCNSLQTYSTRV